MEDYYIEIKDYYNQKCRVKVSYEIYQTYEAARKERERARYEKRVHLDCRELNDYLLANQMTVAENMEEYYLMREELRQVYEALETCTPTQKKRFYLNRVLGYSCREIARMQCCHKHAVEKSIDAALKKIKKYFEIG